MADKRILSVGNCAADHASLTWTVRQNLNAEVTPAASTDEALAKLNAARFNLVLVNRIFDRDGTSGLGFIEMLRQTHGDLPVMLISNYADAQDEAVRLGAVRGFGKAALTDEATLDLLRSALAGSAGAKPTAD